MKNVYIIGAFDRYNYGDILFPLVVEKLINKKVKNANKVTFVAHKAADLRKFGGVKNISWREFKKIKLSDNDVVIFSGGELLGADWKSMLLCLMPSDLVATSIRVFMKLIGPSISNKLSKRILGATETLPWVIDANSPTIIYNCVGGSSIAKLNGVQKENLANYLDKADFIALRDQKGYDLAKEIVSDSQSIKLYPDSAVVISDLYSEDSLIEKSRDSIINYVKNNEYITFQCNDLVGKGNYKKIATELNKIHKEYPKSKFVFLPIGRVPLHSDQNVLMKIQKHINFSPLQIDDLTIEETMYLIKHSKAFIGTSLHGNITAMTFNVPTVGFNKKVDKLNRFLETWYLEDAKGTVEINSIKNRLNTVLNTSLESRKSVSEKVKSEYYKAFNQIVEII